MIVVVSERGRSGKFPIDIYSQYCGPHALPSQEKVSARVSAASLPRGLAGSATCNWLAS